MGKSWAKYAIILLSLMVILESCSNSVDSLSCEIISSIALDEIDEDISSYAVHIEPVSYDITKDTVLLDIGGFPYAGIPRLMIETEARSEIVDKENYLPAQMRFYGDSLAEGPVLDLQIRGRGNSSWYNMPKHSFRLKLNKKQSLLGLPPDKDWALIANYADKTLMKNYLSFRLATDAQMEYSPRCKFLELYVNGEYLGVYLLTEVVEVDKQRVNIPKNDFSYLVEFDAKYKEDEQVVFSKVLGEKKPFRIHSSDKLPASSLKKLRTHIENFEKFLLGVENASLAEIEEWIDMDAYAKHFWIQEFAKNPDANFMTSVFFTWTEGNAIKMGPVWDFDVAYGGFYNYAKSVAQTDGWRTVDAYWNAKLFSNSNFSQKIAEYWKELRPVFENAQAIVDSLQNALELPAKNNFKRWNILQKDGLWIPKKYADYDAAVADLKKWIDERVKWMDSNKF